MDALKAYSDSDSEESSVSRNEHGDNPENDYFGLNFNDDENEIAVKAELDDITLSSRLEEQSTMLHKSKYGPSFLPCSEDMNNLDDNKSVIISVLSNLIPPERKCMKRVFEYGETLEYASEKRQKNLNDCYGFETKSDDELTNFTEIDDIQRKYSIFEPCSKITSQISNETLSRLPSHSRSKFNIHRSCISKICWSSPQYSHLFLSASLDGTVNICNMFTKSCERQLKIHRKGVRAAVWTLCGRKIFSGGYDGKAFLTDPMTGSILNTYSHEGFVTSVQRHPEHESILLTGSINHVMTWDTRISDQHVKKFSSHCGQVLDIAFLSAGKEVICSNDIVSKDSADRTIIAWDFETGALLSNQIYQERYTCPCLRVEPQGENFIAQTNGSYIAIFSSSRPYKMNKNKRYEGHKVAGYSIDCDFSPDGNYVVTGDAEGGIYIYETNNAKIVKKLSTLTNAPTTSVAWHPVLPSTIAVGSITGQLQIWQ